MEIVWFLLLLVILTAYVVLDGFDLGAGAISLFAARGHDERRLILRAIGPVWNGNEVWLIGAAGGLYFAFPRAYASSFSGFYLSLTILLWLLMGRGVGVELRSHIHDPLWWTLFEFVFSASSALLAFMFGVGMGNVIRGVPLDAQGWFFVPLWTDFRTGPVPGILDWYTVLIGVLAFVTLAVHRGHYLAVKTEGPLQARARKIAGWAWYALVLLTAASLVATLAIRSDFREHLRGRQWGWIIPVIVLASLASMKMFVRTGRDGRAFAASTAYIAAMFSGAALAMYPDLVPASTDPRYTLTVFNTRTGAYSLSVGLIWWIVGVALAIAYFTFVYRSFWGKVATGDEGGY